MKAYIRIRHTGEFFDPSCYYAYTGCREQDIPVVKYKAVYSLTENTPSDPVVGTVDDVRGSTGTVRRETGSFGLSR